MQKSFFKFLFISGIFLLVLNACVKKTNYPTSPVIEYKDFIPFPGDSAYLQIKFTDGDGDIGVKDGDSTKSLFFTYYYLDTVTQKYTAFYQALLNDTLRFNYIVKSPTESYIGKPISGELSVSINPFYRHSKKIKHIKYVIYMLDRAGNKSNVLSTPDITVP